MSFNVALNKPHDKWINALCGNKHNMCQFLHCYKFVKKPKCTDCGIYKSIQLLIGKRDLCRNKLPYKWICDKCGKDDNFLRGCYLYGSRLMLQDHIGLLYKFYLGRTAKEAAAELKIGQTTAKLYFTFFRRCIHEYMQKDWYPKFKFNTEFFIEWDETAQGKQKDHRGNKGKPRWILGGIQRKTKYVCLEHVKGRTGKTLQSYIEQHSNADSVHITDGWKGYLGLDRKGFYHFNLCHKKEFVDPMTGMHTNTIENLWSLLKFD